MSYKSKLKHRTIFWEEDTNRLELEGVFTAEDLKALAEWLENPLHPVGPLSLIDVKLSPL